MSTQKLFLAGSGGQGILLMGQMITHAAMLEGKNATFMPSYGPEMRGGTANCTVVVSDKPISCPIIFEADFIVAMNLPSLIKFETMVKPSGTLLINTSIVGQKAARNDISVVEAPVNDIAQELGNARVANMVMLGALIRTCGVVSEASVETVIRDTLGVKKADMLELNLNAYRYWKN